MLQPKKILVISAIGLICAIAGTGPAAAFRLSSTAPASENQSGLAAYTTGATEASAEQGLLLSSDEINHIRWCAKRYMSYHATDNTYVMADGKRQECRSPTAR